MFLSLVLTVDTGWICIDCICPWLSFVSCLPSSTYKIHSSINCCTSRWQYNSWWASRIKHTSKNVHSGRKISKSDKRRTLRISTIVPPAILLINLSGMHHLLGQKEGHLGFHTLIPTVLLFGGWNPQCCSFFGKLTLSVASSRLINKKETNKGLS